MKIVIAPDSFKENLTSLEVASEIETGLKRVWPDAVYVKVPMADGGEGTVQSLVDATGGQIVNPGGGDPKGAATFVLKVNRVKSRICFNIKFSKIKESLADFDKYLEDAVALFLKTGITTVFVNLEGWPEDWKTNLQAVIEFFREHQRPSFLEYGEYPYVSADEIKKALRVKSALSSMLDQMQ